MINTDKKLVSEIIEFSEAASNKESNISLEKYGKFKNEHELYAVLKEEIEEALDEMKKLNLSLETLWDCVKFNNQFNIQLQLEFMQSISRKLICEVIQVLSITKRFTNERRLKK